MHLLRWIAGACFCVAAASAMAVSSAHADQPPETQITPPQDVRNPAAVAKALWDQCLGEGRQVILRPDKWGCMNRYDGEKLLHDLEPDKFDAKLACQERELRWMPTGVLQLIGDFVAENAKTPNKFTRDIQKNGIRIIGGAYCQDEVNLSDFKLLVPLNLDRSVLKFGFRARDMTIAGNLSFDGSYVYDNFDVSDSKIEGTLFGSGAFIQRFRLTNTEVREALRFNNSILLGYFMLTKVTSRLVGARNSKISSFVVRQSAIAERLDLRDSEASCKYQIEKSELNEVLAANSGFGKTGAKPTIRIWSRKYVSPKFDGIATKSILEVKAVEMLYANTTECDDSIAKFSISGGSARSIQLQNFYWADPAPNGVAAPTHLEFNKLSFVDTMSVDLWNANRTDLDTVKSSDRIFKIEGTKIGALFIDYGDNERPYVTAIDQIGIDRVHTVGGRWATPGAKEVTAWLRKNSLSSLQPYAAFIKAFENAGVDATDLKVAKAGKEFHQSFEKYGEELKRAWNNASKNGEIIRFLWEDGWHVLIDYPAFGAKWILGYIADFGFRPAQVIWTVLIIVAGSWLIFWLAVRIVAFEMEKKKGMRPVGIAFLFDRLLPIYRLRDDHYDIGAYYQRGSGPDSKKIRYFGRSIECIPASPRRVRFVEMYLDFLKLLGIILAAFLVAAVNALIAR